MTKPYTNRLNYPEISAQPEVPLELYVRPGFTSSRPPLLPTPELQEMNLLERFDPDIVGQVTTQTETVAVVSKLDPHTITDAMISIFGHDQPVVTFADASHEGRQTVLRWMHGFVQYTTDKEVRSNFGLEDSFLRIAVNIDHGTADRGAIQGLRTLHPHCLCFPALKQYIESRPLRQEEPNAIAPSAIDPLSTLGPMILADYFRAGIFSESVYRSFEFVSHNDIQAMPLAFTLRLKDSWDTLLAPEAGEALKDLDLRMADIYRGIKKAITGEVERGQPWQRPRPLDAVTIERNIDALPLLSELSRDGLKRMAATLRAVPMPVMDRLRESRKQGGLSLAEKILAFSDLAYGMNFYAPGTIEDMTNDSLPDKPAYLAIQPLLRRPSGVSGFSFDAEGKLFTVERGPNAQALTPELVAERHAFQAGFVKSLDVLVRRQLPKN